VGSGGGWGLGHRFKHDLQPRAGRRRVFAQRRCGRPDAAALQPCDNALRSVHPQRQFRLRQAGAGPGLDEICCQRKLLVQRFIVRPVFWVGEPLLVQVADIGHLRAIARWRATKPLRLVVMNMGAVDK
jgi:hypothetical protein